MQILIRIGTCDLFLTLAKGGYLDEWVDDTSMHEMFNEIMLMINDVFRTVVHKPFGKIQNQFF